MPAAAPKGLVVYIHGGYWMRFDKSSWSHLAQGALASGYAVAMPSYSLCPSIGIAGIVAEAANYELLLSSFFTVWLKAKPQVMFERVLGQHDARIASAELREEALENIERTLQARQHLYELASASLDTTGRTAGALLPSLIALIPQPARAEPAPK